MVMSSPDPLGTKHMKGSASKISHMQIPQDNQQAYKTNTMDVRNCLGFK